MGTSTETQLRLQGAEEQRDGLVELGRRSVQKSASMPPMVNIPRVARLNLGIDASDDLAIQLDPRGDRLILEVVDDGE